MNPTMLIIRVVVLIAAFILVISLLQFFVSIHPPRYSSTNTPADLGFEYENVSFNTSDNIQIKAWWIASKKAKGTVIIGHGYPFDKGNILPVASFLYPDYNLLFYDHRYFGESAGRISTVGIREVHDVNAAIQFVEQKSKGPIALYGFSLSASAMLMSKAEVNAIISDSAYADLETMTKHVYGMFGPLKFPFVKLTNLLAIIFFRVHPKEVSPALTIKDTDIPIFVIHGEFDSQIPVENAHLLKKSQPGIELWIAEGCDHGQAYALHKEEYENRIKDFLKKHMK